MAVLRLELFIKLCCNVIANFTSISALFSLKVYMLSKRVYIYKYYGKIVLRFAQYVEIPKYNNT